jgi:protein-S-isoprenylcysteine O-methyltransferase Ste14
LAAITKDIIGTAMNLLWILLASQLFIHLVLVVKLLLTENRLGKESNDKRKDPLFSFLNIILAYVPMLGFQAYGLYERFFEIGNPIYIILGSTIFFVGTFMRIYAMRTLGQFFTMEIGIRKNHRIIQDGPYERVRHPSYTGYLLMLLGIGVAYQNLFSLIFPLGEMIIFLSVRIPQEEKMLCHEFGDEYRNYQKRTKLIIPHLF